MLKFEHVEMLKRKAFQIDNPTTRQYCRHVQLSTFRLFNISTFQHFNISTFSTFQLSTFQRSLEDTNLKFNIVDNYKALCRLAIRLLVMNAYTTC